MRLLPLILILLALACESFAYWGLNTVPGRAMFDEMAGMIPLAAAPLGLVFLLTAALVFWRNRTR